MKTKRIISLLLCLALLSLTAFASEYTYGSGKAYTQEDVLSKFTKLIKGIGVTPDPVAENTEEQDAGFAYISADAFVMGGGFVVEPTKAEIRPGDTAASVLIRTLALLGIYSEYDGTDKADFYLHRLGGAEFSPQIEPGLEEWLKGFVDYYEPYDWSGGVLGEYDITNMSGWMYFINGEMPSQAMSEYEVQDGDVITLRFSLAYGMDLGGEAFGDCDEPYCETVNFDGAVKGIANGSLDRDVCEEVLNKAGVTQEEVDELLRKN